MSLKSIIRKGDSTTHGGTVIEGIDSYLVFDKPIACEGHMVTCPQCKGTFPIIEGVKGKSILGKNPAVEDMHTACGAKLIASQDQFQLEQLDAIENNQAEEINTADTNWLGTNLQDYGVRFQLTEYDEENSYPLRHVNYSVFLSDGSIQSGCTNDEGYTSVITSDQQLTVDRIELESESHEHSSCSCCFYTKT